MLDSDVARIYHYETRKINQAVKRNIERFPIDFCFQLNEEEFEFLRSQIVILNNKERGQHRKFNQFENKEIIKQKFNKQYPTLKICKIMLIIV